ncbi:MAG: ComEA family DNA-binding protein [Candidatus Sumerlaeaceae bacterium]|nr:ComEA family DNA-binding protein [Candidatus Sumerlaeaceae bacterium]
MWASFTRAERNLILTLVALIGGGSALTFFDGNRFSQPVFQAGARPPATADERPPVSAVRDNGAPQRSAGMPVTSDGRIDINSATADALETLPGIGPAKAAAIIEHRMRFGPFKTIHDVDKVSGIGPATLRQMEPLIAFGVSGTPSPQNPESGVPRPPPPAPPAPSAAAPHALSLSASTPTSTQAATPPPASPQLININTASLEELMRLPAIGEVKARAIIDYRRTHGPFSDPAQIQNVHGIGQKTFEAIRGRICVR